MNTLQQPIFFRSNRVRRIYTGGKLFSAFFGDDSEDGFYPEEWICSTTRALNAGSTDPNEGISVTEDGTYFDELLRAHPHELLGERKELDVLVKMLDSAIRLPVQTHPDRAFSLRHFGSTHGKAESWVVLATREDACIYFGFKEPVSRETFRAALEGGDDALLPLLNRIPVKPGDVFFIPARAVHAIGAGCLILETQEPTDFTIQPEATCGTYVLNEYEKYLGLAADDAFDCFDMNFTAERAAVCQRTCAKGETALITEQDTPCFSVNRYTLEQQDSVPLAGPAIYVVTDGAGDLVGDGYTRRVKKGDYFFMPHAASARYRFHTTAQLQAVQCLPPK